MTSRHEKERAKQIQEKCQNLLTQMLRDEDNKYCVDCDAKGSSNDSEILHPYTDALSSSSSSFFDIYNERFMLYYSYFGVFAPAQSALRYRSQNDLVPEHVEALWICNFRLTCCQRAVTRNVISFPNFTLTLQASSLICKLLNIFY